MPWGAASAAPHLFCTLMVNFLCQKVEVDTIKLLWYNMVNREHGGVTMAEKQPVLSSIFRKFGSDKMK